MSRKRKAVVLLSGGLDSATTLYWAQNQGFLTYGLIFDYGQRHSKEVRQAKKIAQVSGTPFHVLRISLPWQGSSLLNKKISLPQGRKIVPEEIPSTYVPGRNIIFLSFAVSYAEALGAEAVFIGANAVDYSGYPDCRPDFFKMYQNAINKGTKTGAKGKSIKVHTPLIKKTKAQIIRMGMKLSTPYYLTWSCYKGGKKPCGKCDSCVLRQKGFKEAGIKDPLK